MSSKLHISIPALFFFGFISLANLIAGLYAGFSIQPSACFQPIYALIVWTSLSWWVIDDSRKHGWEWLHSWGIFLYVVGWLIVPYYLFKTRGAKALLIIVLFVVLYLGTFIAGWMGGAAIAALLRG